MNFYEEFYKKLSTGQIQLLPGITIAMPRDAIEVRHTGKPIFIIRKNGYIESTSVLFQIEVFKTFNRYFEDDWEVYKTQFEWILRDVRTERKYLIEDTFCIDPERIVAGVKPFDDVSDKLQAITEYAQFWVDTLFKNERQMQQFFANDYNAPCCEYCSQGMKSSLGKLLLRFNPLDCPSLWDHIQSKQPNTSLIRMAMAYDRVLYKQQAASSRDMGLTTILNGVLEASFLLKEPTKPPGYDEIDEENEERTCLNCLFITPITQDTPQHMGRDLLWCSFPGNRQCVHKADGTVVGLTVPCREWARNPNWVDPRRKTLQQEIRHYEIELAKYQKRRAEVNAVRGNPKLAELFFAILYRQFALGLGIEILG